MRWEAEEDSWIWRLFAHCRLLEWGFLFGGGVVGVFEVVGFDFELVQRCGIVHRKLIKDMAVCYLVEVIESR